MTYYMRTIIFYLLTTLMLVGCKVEEKTATKALEEKAVTKTPALLPLARTTTFTNGKFEFGSDIRINIEAPEEDKENLQNLLNGCLGTNTASKGNTLNLLVSEDVEGVESSEGYRMEIGKNTITITAKSGAGLFYGVQTLLQLADGGNSVPTGTICDEPQFAYRGMMLDVSRHFFGKEFVKKQIDAMAQFKMNRLHLHLTDALHSLPRGVHQQYGKTGGSATANMSRKAAREHTAVTIPKRILKSLLRMQQSDT